MGYVSVYFLRYFQYTAIQKHLYILYSKKSTYMCVYLLIYIERVSIDIYGIGKKETSNLIYCFYLFFFDILLLKDSLFLIAYAMDFRFIFFKIASKDNRGNIKYLTVI